MSIMSIMKKVVHIMNKYSKYSHLEDLIRIKSGYMPKMHFIFLYNIITILIVLKLFVNRVLKNSTAGIFNYEKLHKNTYRV